MSINENSKFEFVEANVTHDGTNAFITTFEIKYFLKRAEGRLIKIKSSGLQCHTRVLEMTRIMMKPKAHIHII